MAVVYEFRLYNPNGLRVATFDDCLSATIQHRIGSADVSKFVLNGNDSRCQLFQPDCMLEFWRKDDAYGIDFYKEAELFHRRSTYEITDQGEPIFTSFGIGYEDLLRRRWILYDAGSVYTSKLDTAETCMKDFVNENLGPNATNPFRWRNGTMPGVTIQFDSKSGLLWGGEKAQLNLNDVVSEISAYSQLYYKMVGLTPGTFQFNTTYGQPGEDRTNDMIDPVTGLNPEGNTPVVFSIPLGNMFRPTYEENHMGSTSLVYITGDGVQSDKNRTVVVDPVELGLSPWSDSEYVQNQRGTDSNGLASAGGSVIYQRQQGIYTYKYNIQQIVNTLYGQHFFCGDRVTANMFGTTLHKIIAGVTVDLTSSGELAENISMDLQDWI
jgi:hypothetical protein